MSEYHDKTTLLSNSQTTSMNNNYSYDYLPFNSIQRSTPVSHPLIIIIDLDNTLIFSSTQPFSISDFIITVNESDSYETYYILKRPHLDDFLSHLIKFSTLYLYTTATRDYTNQILSNIDPLKIYFKKVFCREDCIKEDNNIFIKDLSKCNADLSRTILIDNNPEAYGSKNKHSNHIPILPFHGSNKDRELPKMIQLLENYAYVDDVRKPIYKNHS